MKTRKALLKFNNLQTDYSRLRTDPKIRTFSVAFEQSINSQLWEAFVNCLQICLASLVDGKTLQLAAKCFAVNWRFTLVNNQKR